jgi:prepilin-type N-terminal cleavage/methylation domain-containing protein
MSPMRNKSLLSKIRNDRGGFTLVEVMIALTIMTIAFGTILTIQTQALSGTTKAEQLGVVSMLAKNQMIETEYLIEGKPFNEIKEEEGGAFPEPYQDYTWKRVIKEIKFPTLNLNAAAGGGDKDKGGDGATDQTSGMVAKLVSNFFSKAMREVTVTVTWKRAGGDQSYSISTYWVDLNHEFQLSQ